MNLDISTAVQVAFFLSAVGFLLCLILGTRVILSGQKLKFFRKRRDTMLRGWRLVLIGIIMGALAFSLRNFAEPAIYRVFPPSPTITLTPTVSLTPTITLTSTITLTPTITDTPAISPTPQMPPVIVTQFISLVTPKPDVVFSPLLFTQQIEKNLPVEPSITFANPVGRLYGTFSYDKMTPGAQWSALWIRLSDGTLICYETKPWDGGTGGYGYTDCNPSSNQWLPGDYEVQLFIGMTWQSSGRFSVTGTPPTPTITPTPSRTLTSSPTITPTRSITPTPSVTPTHGPTFTTTPIPSQTQTLPPTATNTRAPTFTINPTRTPRVADTYVPPPTITPRIADTYVPPQ